MSDKIITNEELQLGLSDSIRRLDDAKPDLARTRVYASLAGKLLKSVKCDMECADKMGKPYFKRTNDFLGVK